MLQLARRSAPGTFNRSGADPVASPSLENETLSSFAILISRRPTSISVVGQPTFNVTPRSRHHDIGLSSRSSGAVSPASTDDSSTRLYASRGSSPITAMAWRASAHLVSSSTSRAAAIPLPTMTSGSVTGYPVTGYPCSAPDCDHMLRKSCSRTACHKRCPTHPPLPASSHPPGPSPASTATRRRPPDSAPPSHRS
jgi:hypothetical protein